MTNTNDTLRANKLSVRPTEDGFIADFYRTHTKIATVNSSNTEWSPIPDSNKSAQREEFRSWIGNRACAFGVTYDPTDRRSDDNKRMATYSTYEDLSLDTVSMILNDITAFIEKMPDNALVTDTSIAVEDIRPMTKTTKGTDLTTMGIYDGRYLKNNNWAWADIDVMVTLTVGNTEIYQPIAMQLVSGQLKKMHMTQTAWNTDTHKSLIEAGLVVDEPKAGKPASTKEKPAPTAEVSAKTAKTSKPNPAKDCKGFDGIGRRSCKNCVMSINGECTWKEV